MIRSTFLAVAAVALVAAPAAQARSFERTFPHASRLCAKVANGHAPKRLAANAGKVNDACAALRTSYTNAQTAFTNAAGPLRQQAADATKARRATCQGTDRAACRQARKDTRAKLRDMRHQLREAKRTYHVAIQNARTTFWTTVKALRG